MGYYKNLVIAAAGKGEPAKKAAAMLRRDAKLKEEEKERLEDEFSLF